VYVYTHSHTGTVRVGWLAAESMTEKTEIGGVLAAK
jgi:hypothetical protein